MMPSWIADILSPAWKFLNGKKTYFGLLITLIAFLAGWLPSVAVAFPTVIIIAKAAGLTQALNGILHAAYKLATGEEHP